MDRNLSIVRCISSLSSFWMMSSIIVVFMVKLSTSPSMGSDIVTELDLRISYILFLNDLRRKYLRCCTDLIGGLLKNIFKKTS